MKFAGNVLRAILQPCQFVQLSEMAQRTYMIVCEKTNAPRMIAAMATVSIKPNRLD